MRNYRSYAVMRALHAGETSARGIVKFLRKAEPSFRPPGVEETKDWDSYDDKRLEITVKNILRELERNGMVYRNGDLWIITEMGLDVIRVIDATGGYTDLALRMYNKAFELLRVLYEHGPDRWMKYDDIRESLPTFMYLVYGDLERLRRDGLVEKANRAGDRKPYYRLTEGGVRAFLAEHRYRKILDLQIGRAGRRG